MDDDKLKEYCKNNYKLKYNEDLNTINLELKEDSNKPFMTLLPCISNPTNLEKLIGNEFEVCLENNSNYSKIKCDEYKESKMIRDDTLLNNNLDINGFENATNVNDYNDADSKKQMILLNEYWNLNYSPFKIDTLISFPFDSISQYISDYNMITSGKIDTEIMSSTIYEDIDRLCKNKNLKWYVNNDNALELKESSDSLETFDICGIEKNYFNETIFQKIFDPCYSNDSCDENILNGKIYDGKLNELCRSEKIKNNDGKFEDKCRTKKEKLYDVMKDMNQDENSIGGDAYINNNIESIYNIYTNKPITLDNETQIFPNILNKKDSFETLYNREYDYESHEEMLDDMFKENEDNIKIPFLEISSLLNQYNKLIGGDIDDNDNIITTEFEDLKDTNYWGESKNPIDINNKGGEEELTRILENKLPENHPILSLIEQSNFSTLFKNIRDNTKEYIGNKDTIPEGYESKLLLIEIQLYLYQLDEDTSINDSLISDINLNPVHPSQIQSITRQYNSNKDFQKCIQTEFSSIQEDIENIKNYTNKSNKSNKIDFDTYLDSLVVVLKRIKEMSPYTIYNCMEIVLEVDEICKGNMIKEYIQLLQLLFTYTNINISIDENPDDYSKMIDRTYPLMKDIYKNLIEYTKSHPQCVGNSNDVVESYDKIYEKLFSKEKPTIKYNLFSNVSISTFFSDFTNNIYGKIILLIFLSFIFAQIVKLFTIQPQVPIK